MSAPHSRHVTSEEALRRWPRLAQACQWVAILSRSEAACALRDHANGAAGSCEAVDHYGGTEAVIRDAWRTRHQRPQPIGRKSSW